MKLFKSTLRVTFLSILLPVVKAQGNNDDACTLNCPLDAPCVFGEITTTRLGSTTYITASDDASSSTTKRQQHCACPPGWTGIMCDTKYESCSSVDKCFHGGKCVAGAAVDEFGNSQLVCDCSTAQSTTKYVGKYCEHAMEQQCDVQNPDLFCVNGGECNPDVAYDGIACRCPDGYHGVHCEYTQEEVPHEEYCTLNCANSGTCLLGQPNPDKLQELLRIWGTSISSSTLEQLQQMQCVCPPGFGGPLCQSTQVMCGNEEEEEEEDVTTGENPHFCYHGGQCVKTTTGAGSSVQTSYRCDCTTAFEEDDDTVGDTRYFTGDNCQVPSTTLCGDKSDPSFFCTHDGICPSFSHQPCGCLEGYSGHKCEYHYTMGTASSTLSQQAVQSLDDTSTIPVPCGSISCLHGSECKTRSVSDDTNTMVEEQYCDCTMAQRPDLFQAFAGNACQYQATSICTAEAAATSPPDLSSFCVHQGQCLDSPTEDGSYCSCPDGWEGPHCEQPAAPLPSNDGTNDIPACGDTVCYNGGKCVETSITTNPTNDDGSATTRITHYCDCSQALDDQFFYSGKSCEYHSTSICGDPLNDETVNPVLEPGMFFCANQGTCRLENLQLGCICPDGFSGFHCEYLNVDVNLDDGDDGDDDDDSSTSEEPPVAQCDDSLYCRNGGTCVSTTINQNGETRHVQHCDCSTTATDSTIFAGTHCEHAVTSFCTDPFDGGMANALFCVQGGTCRANVFEGCDCPDGWTGFRCEYAIDQDSLLNDSNNNDPATVATCGDMVCYNGGTCTSTEEGHSSCDCSTAITTSTDTGLDEFYGGPTCSVKSTSVCDDSSSQQEDAWALPMVCMNHGTCRQDPSEGCDCPPGFTGKTCDLEVQDDEHKEHGVPCGDTYCYHGGRCNSFSYGDSNGQSMTREYCDCSRAFDDTHLYAGDSCQHKSTSLCTQPIEGLSLAGTLFCVNGGTCRPDKGANYSASFQQGCDCPAGWNGFSCEFPEDLQDAIEDINNAVDHELCGDNVCLNGGKCVTTRISSDDGNSYDLHYCDCAYAHDDDHLFAGPNCEYPSSSLCADPDPQSPSLQGTPFCVNGGACNPDNVVGECSCSSHWTGFRCEFPVDDVAVGQSDPCGSTVCQHGGRCEDGYCNCLFAMEGGLRYDGPSCQYPATDYCDNPHEADALSQVDFCVNGGRCQDGDLCACPTGFFGPRCEMPVDGNDDVEPPSNATTAPYNCRLSCANGGSCVKGVRDNSLGIYHEGIGQVAHLNATFDETFFEHCVCPPGFIGLQCQHPVEMCGQTNDNGDEHYCLHGSKCVQDNLGNPACDCDDAHARIDGKLETTFGGEFCQHPATDICMSQDSNRRDPIGPLYFCVNEGKCRDYVTPNDANPGCDCANGWIGTHCEISTTKLSQMGQQQRLDDADGPGTGLLVWATLMLIMVLCLLIVYARRLASAAEAEASDDGAKHQEPKVSDLRTVIRNRLLLRRAKALHLQYVYDGAPNMPQDGIINLAPKRRSTFFLRSAAAAAATPPAVAVDLLEPEHRPHDSPASLDEGDTDAGRNPENTRTTSNYRGRTLFPDELVDDINDLCLEEEDVVGRDILDEVLDIEIV